MDRNLMRKLAKQEFKKMMNGVKRAQRPTFAQAWPLIKSTLEGKNRETPAAQEQLTIEDVAALDSMLVDEQPIEVEHVHGPDCNHEVVKIDI